MAATALKISKDLGKILKYFFSQKVYPINFVSFFIEDFANFLNLGGGED